MAKQNIGGFAHEEEKFKGSQYLKAFRREYSSACHFLRKE